MSAAETQPMEYSSMVSSMSLKLIAAIRCAAKSQKEAGSSPTTENRVNDAEPVNNPILIHLHALPPDSGLPVRTSQICRDCTRKPSGRPQGNAGKTTAAA